LSEVANEEVQAAPLLQSTIDKCLCKEIEGRYRTVSDLLADLKTAREQFSGKVGIERRPRVSTARLSPRFVSLAAVVLLLAIAITGTLLYRRSATLNQANATNPATARPLKLYSQMSDAERLQFVAEQEQRISTMMGERPVKLDESAVRYIKAYVDSYASRMNGPPDEDSGSMIAVYERAPPFVPMIARSFAARKVPVIIGIYLPVIESGYQPCSESPFGAKGLYQFLPSTAQNYGVSRAEMCDPEKMAPAAAHYIADRMAELGEDSQSVTLVLLSYNRGAEWVRDSLRQLRGTENYARNFWTLFANREALDEDFRKETQGYVPSFLAAAIIGENPEVFGLKTPPLSTLAER
jgi:hypothetical protein